MKKLSLWETGSACIGIVIAVFVLVAVPYPKHRIENPLAAEVWKEVREKVDLLEISGLMPTLLPTIMLNRDALQLTDEQVNAFHLWRNENYTNMVNVMNEIIARMVEFRIASLSPGISNERLIALQARIQDLQHQVLAIKLSCREIIMTTFTDAQWENFAFVVSDNPKLAGLISQANSKNVKAKN